MRSKTIIHMISCHAEGEVGNVIVGGVAPPPGDSLWEQARWIAQDQALRQFVLNEPRGGVFKHINLLLPAKHPEAEYGFIIMEPEHTPPMSGSNSICVSTVLLDSGLIPMQEPVTEFILEAPGGLVPVKAYCENGKATSIEVHNVPSFADQIEVTIRHHALESGCFVINATGWLSEDQVERISPDPKLQKALSSGCCTAIISPDGSHLCDPVREGEGMAIAELEFSLITKRKRMLDSVGHYARPDIFRLYIDQSTRPQAIFGDVAPTDESEFGAKSVGEQDHEQPD